MKTILTVSILCLLLGLVGCGTLVERSGGELVITDDAGEQLVVTSGVVDAMASDGTITQAEIIGAVREALSTNPKFNPATIATVQEVPETLTPTPEAQAWVDVARVLPIPYADAVAMGLSGVLGIAAVWQRKRKTTAEKTSASLVKAVDTFRDVLDQTEGGHIIDAELTKLLRTEQAQAGAEVVSAVKELLDRYYTPDKPKGGLNLTAAQPTA